jgi:hypothetical protein
MLESGAGIHCGVTRRRVAETEDVSTRRLTAPYGTKASKRVDGTKSRKIPDNYCKKSDEPRLTEANVAAAGAAARAGRGAESCRDKVK